MSFELGIITGLILTVLAFVILAFLRKPTESIITTAAREIENHAPNQKGFVVMPRDEATIAREAHIAENAERGASTPISELM